MNAPSDYFQFDEMLSKEERAVRHRTRAVVAKYLTPDAINDAWEKAEMPLDVVKHLVKSGACGGMIKGYGCPGLTPMGAAVAALEVAKADGGIGTSFMVHSHIAMLAIDLCGTEAQKRRYLPRMATLELFGSFALTEPDIGSDAAAVRTTATPVPGGYRLNGAKRWIGNATHNSVIVVWARNTRTGKIGGYIVRQGAPGLTTRKIEHKAVARIVQNADITLDNVFVGNEDCMASVGFANGPGKCLKVTRIFASWAPVGIAMGAYESALKYTLARRQFGVPVAAFQLVQEKLVRMAANIQAMFLMAHRLTRLFEQGKMTSGQASMCKAHNTLRGRECVALAREVCGGNGIVTDYHVVRAFGDMEAVHTYEGSYDVNVLVTGRELTGLNAFMSTLGSSRKGKSKGKGKGKGKGMKPRSRL